MFDKAFLAFPLCCERELRMIGTEPVKEERVNV